MNRPERSRRRKALYRLAIHQDEHEHPQWEKVSQDLSVEVSELQSIWSAEQEGRTSLLNPKRVEELRQDEANKSAKLEQGRKRREEIHSKNKKQHYYNNPHAVSDINESFERDMRALIDKQYDDAITAVEIMWRKRSPLDRFILENYPSILDGVLELIDMASLRLEGDVVSKVRTVEDLKRRIEDIVADHRHEEPQEALERFEERWRKIEEDEEPHPDMELARKQVLLMQYYGVEVEVVAESFGTGE
jgi:hypothetical protein